MRNKCSKWLAKSLSLAIVMLSFAPVTSAQTVGAIEGLVTDQNGAVVQNASVTATDKSKNFSRTSTTNDVGQFKIENLPPATYEVRVSGPNFKTTVYQDVTVNVGTNTTLDAVLQVGGAAEEVTVVGGGEAQIDRSENTVAGVVGTVQIDNLPLNGRNFLDLAQLQPGTEKVDGATFDPTKANYTGISIAGQAGRSTQITVDGGSVVDNVVGTTTQNFSQEIVQEFQLGISNMDLSTGASATGSVNVVSRSGGNDFHGNGYLYARDSRWSAFPALFRFDAANGLPPNARVEQVPFDRQQYGGTISGPIKRDRAFFFFNYEGNNQDGAAVHLPTGFGAFSGFTGQPFDEKLLTAKGDVILNNQNNLIIRYSFNDNEGQNPFPLATGIVPRGTTGPFTTNDQLVTNRTHGLVVGLVSSLSSSLTNDFRYNFNDFSNVIVPASTDETFGETRVWNLGDQSWRSGHNYITTQTTFQHRNQFRDDLTWARGSQTLRFGVNYERSSITGQFDFATPWRVRLFGPDDDSSIVLNTEADFLNAPVRDFSMGIGNSILPFADPSGKTINHRYQLYGTDSWKVRPNFTLNFGLAYRWDSNLYNTDLTRPALIAPLFDKGTAAPSNDTNNFAPRLGFAYDVGGGGKTVVRGGVGIYYDTVIDNLRLFERADLGRPGSELFLTGTAIRSTLLPGGDARFSTSATSSSGFIRFRDLLPLLPQVRTQMEARVSSCALPTGLECAGAVSGPIFQQNYEVPYSIQWSIGVQRELPWKMLAQVDYNFRKGLHESFIYDANRATSAAGPKIAAFPQIIHVAESSAFSTYSALLARVDRRFANGFQLTGSYTLSRFKAFGTDTLGLGAAVTDLNNFRTEFGPAGLDRTHRMVLSGLWELPYFKTSNSWAKRNLAGGWVVSMISTAFSGVPRSAFIPHGVNLSGTTQEIGSYLPGTRPGDIGRRINSVGELNSIIQAYNTSIPTLGIACGSDSPTGRCDPFGTPLELVETLPANTQIGGDSLISQDLRLTKRIRFGEHMKLDLIGEVFNLFNVANLTGFSTEDVVPGGYTPTDRQTSIFGTGGPRSFQFGARFSW